MSIRYLAILIAPFLSIPTKVFAQTEAATALQQGLVKTGNAAGFGTQSQNIYMLIGYALSALFGLLGIVFLILLVYAGILYLLDRGEGKNVEKGKKIISASIQGMVIVVVSYGLSQFILAILSTILKG